MANAGSVVIKINGDESAFEKSIRKVERSASSAAASLAQTFRKAGMDQSSAMSKAWSEVQNAYKNGTSVIINGVETIITENKQLRESIDDVSGEGYKELAKSSEAAARQTNRSMESMERGATKMSNGIKGAAKAAGIALKGITIVASAVSAVWSAVGVVSVKHNAEIEQLQTSFKVMTGSAEKAASVMERLRKLGATTPFATKDLAEATQLLMQYGMDADTAIDRMSMLGDIAQGSTDKMMRIAAAYGQMNATGKVSLEDVKQMIDFCHAA